MAASQEGLRSVSDSLSLVIITVFYSIIIQTLILNSMTYYKEEEDLKVALKI
jgi:hypothetical protein